jgi:hypothetical protein
MKKVITMIALTAFLAGNVAVSYGQDGEKAAKTTKTEKKKKKCDKSTCCSKTPNKTTN